MKIVTQNACQLCAPLGASLVFKGIKNCVPLLHGSQGCATYIRRYLISHFREPIDIASSSFTEETAVFGGEKNLRQGLDNVIRQYEPDVVGIASTCLSETIGDNVPSILKEWLKDRSVESSIRVPELVQVSTPSYSGSHSTGFHQTVLALTSTFAGTFTEKEESCDSHDLNLFPGMISTEDIRNLKYWLGLYGIKGMILPDYSESLDGPAWYDYQKIPGGGCPVESIKVSSRAKLSLELSGTLDDDESSAFWLFRNKGVQAYSLPQPIGIDLSDLFFSRLSDLSGRDLPDILAAQRGRLLDAYADAHKYLYGRKAVVFGEKDHVLALSVFLEEIGIIPVLCATGEGKGLKSAMDTCLKKPEEVEVLDYSDFDEIEKRAAALSCDLAVGNSKGYKLSKSLGIPLIRTGFPVHDRIGAQRLSCLGYSGTQLLFDRIVNTVMEEQQNSSPVGYTYI